MNFSAQSLGNMQPYGAEHVFMLVIIVVLAAAARAFGHWLRRVPQREQWVTRALGFVLLAAAVAWFIGDLLPSRFTIAQSLPIHLSDVLRVVVALALIFRNPLCIAISYYWGLTFNLMAIVTPDLNYIAHPPLEFASYWLAHGAALLVSLLLVFGLGYQPTWRGYFAMWGATLVWAAVAMSVNTALGTNYGYLSAVPPSGSILDALGGWPLYLAWAALLLALAWMLMTLPWQSRRLVEGAEFVGTNRLLRRRPLTPAVRVVATAEPSLR